MASYHVQDIRNIVLCGHGSAGKTTLADHLLTTTGTVKRPASVDDGTSICDFDEEEKHHKHTIESTLVHFDHAGKHFNVIDTPGYPDFIGQTIGAMRAVDTAAIVIDAHSGIGRQHPPRVQGGRQGGPGPDDHHQQDGRRQRRLPRPAGDASRSCSARPACRSTCRSATGTISTAWSARCIRRPRPPAPWSIRRRSTKPLIESIIEVDDGVTERYFEGTLPTRRGTRAADRSTRSPPAA